jgi:hypothetical protein
MKIMAMPMHGMAGHFLEQIKMAKQQAQVILWISK